MAISDRLTKLTTDITNAYTSINNKGGTISANKNTDNLHTAIDSIEVIESATAEGESLSLANTKAMPYSDYIVKGKSTQEGTPSPSNPSEIHSVASKDENLLPFTDKMFIVNNVKYCIKNGNLYLDGTSTSETSSKNSNFKSNFTFTLLAGTYTISHKTGVINVYLYDYDNDTQAITTVGTNATSSTFTLTESKKLYIGFYVYQNSFNNANTDIKIQRGSNETSYTPYGQGTVTIKQRGKNLFDIENYSKSGYNVTITNPLKGLIAGDYTISCQNKHTAGSTIIFSNEINGSRIGEYFTGYDFGRTLTSKTRALTQEQLNAKYMIFQGQDSSITQEVLENMQIQIEEGSTATDYEPYQANDYTIQTEPLRSLPNGVKDSKDTKQHTRVGVKVFDGSEDSWALNRSLENTIWFRNHVAGINSPNVNTICLLSNYFTQKKWFESIRINLDEEFMAQSTINDIYFSFKKGFLPSDTLEGFKTWLSNNPVAVLYPLETEIIEPLTQNQATTMLDIIKTGSYEGTTNIYTDEDVKPTIKVDYYKKS